MPVYWSVSIFAYTSLFVFALLIASNIAVVAIILRSSLRQERFYLLITLLAISDGLACITSFVSLGIIPLIYGPQDNFNETDQAHVKYVCQWFGGLDFAIMFMSALGQQFIAVIRVVAMWFPFWYSKHLTQTRCIILWFSYVWLPPLVYNAFLAAPKIWGAFVPLPPYSLCVPDIINEYRWNQVLDIAFVYYPAISTILCYIVVFAKIKLVSRSVENVENIRRRAKGALSIFLCFVMYCALQVPAPIYFGACRNLVFELAGVNPYLVFGCYRLTFGLNFAVYILSNSQFRKAAKDVTFGCKSGPTLVVPISET